ncbi:MAG TPA: Gfo/Idh/MocA family oxidoreductase [Firmicutes bacterium]|nr:Gfo/Idh/MocA family oxidoreductase [Bacillota bacterium]
MQEIRVGLIGCGGNMRGHIKRLMGIPEVKIAAISDPSEENIQEAIDTLELGRVKRFSDYTDMLARVGLDAVVISSPHTLHARQICDSLRSGLHVLVEKPMVCSVEDALKVIALKEEMGKVVLVSYQRHYAPSYRYARELIQSGKWGKVQFITAWQCQNWKRATVGKWRQDPALSGGGQLNDSGSHLLDIVLWMTGLTPKEVFAYIDNCGTPVDVLSAISVSFQEGAIGNLSVVGDSNTGFDEGINIWCENGMIEIRGAGHGSLILRDPDPRTPDEAELPAGSIPDANFIAAIRGREEVQSTAEDALKVIELTEAAWESARRHQPVAVDHVLSRPEAYGR